MMETSRVKGNMKIIKFTTFYRWYGKKWTVGVQEWYVTFYWGNTFDKFVSKKVFINVYNPQIFNKYRISTDKEYGTGR